MSKTIDKMIKLISTATKKPTIVYAEGDSTYIQQAAKTISQYIDPILIFKSQADIPTDNQFKTVVIDNTDLSPYAQLLYNLRKEKGMTMEEANKLVKQPNYLSALIVKMGQADGEICGIDYTTKDTLKPALQIIKTDKESKLVSSIFILEKGEEICLFSDCAININPQADQLANMTEMACAFAKKTLNIKKPKAALLSYSTVGSGVGESVEKVKNALAFIRANKKNEDYDIFGEMQFDAAYDDRVRAKKAKNCSWKTKPDIFMFPNIDAANIGYKIAQRMGGYAAFGPVLVGLAAPVNDLSRGATVQDIIGLSYLTAAQIVTKQTK